MDEPLVSILMPVKNTEAYLAECLDSIRSQSYEQWELLAVNDHSEDGSRNLLASYAKKDPRIRLQDNPGKGIIPALRAAYSMSSGSLVTRMDSDDVMAPTRLRQMAAALVEQGTGYLGVGQVRYFSDSGISDGYARYERWLNGLTAQGTNFDEIYKECVIPSPCWMAWRTDLDSCGGFASDRYPEDYDLCFRFYGGGLQCIPGQQVLHYWRDYPQRTSRTSEKYAQNYFLDIKTHYFLKLHYTPARKLFVWGAGFKGKKIARLLIAANIPFTWICDNPNKIGKRIYGQLLRHFDVISSEADAQSLVTVANAAAQQEIRTYLDRLGARPMADYFFFC